MHDEQVAFQFGIKTICQATFSPLTQQKLYTIYQDGVFCFRFMFYHFFLES